MIQDPVARGSGSRALDPESKQFIKLLVFQCNLLGGRVAVVGYTPLTFLKIMLAYMLAYMSPYMLAYMLAFMLAHMLAYIHSIYANKMVAIC